MKRRRKTGATLPRGPQSGRAATVAIGPRGRIAKPGRTGLKTFRPSRHDDNVLEVIVKHFEEVYRQLNEQLRLIAKIQQQVNGLVATATRLSERPQDGSVS